jgi:sortase A
VSEAEPAKGEASERKRWRPSPRVLRIAATALITAGVVVLLDVGLTLAWKEPVSSIYASILQGGARDDIEDLEDQIVGASGATDEKLLRSAHEKANEFEGLVEPGQGIGSVRIPAIDADFALIEGVDLDDLQAGPGRYERTAFPGQGETVGIAGHRTTYLAPFRRLDKLEKDDEVIVEMPYATFTYRVTRAKVVEPDLLRVVRPVGRERVVMTACHPVYSAAQRYVVFANLTGVAERTES